LSDLIELGFSSFGLDIKPDAQLGVPVDPVAAGLAIELEAERPEQLLEIADSNVAASGNDALPGLGRLHSVACISPIG
jgi:hypothetical protein